MIIKQINVWGFPGALHGMRQPMQSFGKADTDWTTGTLGPNDGELAKKLIQSGTPERKFLRMIHVQMDVTAMQPWWSEFDTYKVGTVRNSSSKMHRIHVKAFTPDDFTTEGIKEVDYAWDQMMELIATCNQLRDDFNNTGDKKYWRALIEILPEGYNMTATIDLNYETLRQIYRWRKHHKLTEWQDFCFMIEHLPLAELITMPEVSGDAR